MTLSFEFWLRKRSKDYWTRQNARQDLRWRLAKQLRDESKRGKGNRAWKRVDALDREPGTLIWPNYAL
jgi:hypothetical protein